jgi:hypothetical protein
METEQLDAREALEAVAQGRREAADRLVTPWWYHPILGLLIGALIVVQGTHSFVLKTAVPIAVLGGAGALIASYTRLTGLWVSGYRRGPAGRWTVALVVGYLAAYGVAAGFGSLAASIPAGAFVFVFTVVVGRGFDEALRREIRG